MNKQYPGLEAFVKESNLIEGIGAVRKDDIKAHIYLLDQPQPFVGVLEQFVRTIRGGPLRQYEGMDVRIGTYVPRRGGPKIRQRLRELLEMAEHNTLDPWVLHVNYEKLHPFMDGNGRSGRALWAWQILNHGHWPKTLEKGFLHPAYYGALRYFTRD